MQNGSVIRAKRQRGPDVWEFRWREPGADGKRKHRRMILESTEQLADETTARQAIATLRLDLNHGEAWLKTRSTQFRSGARRAASFVSSRRLQRLLVETGLLEVFLTCACSKWRDRCENTAASMKSIRIDSENCACFVPI